MATIGLGGAAFLATEEDASDYEAGVVLGIQVIEKPGPWVDDGPRVLGDNRGDPKPCSVLLTY